MSTRTTLRRSAALPAATLLLMLALAPAGAGGGLTLTTPFPGVSVAPGTDVSFDITISAAANTRVALSVSGTPAGWTSTLRGGGFVVDAVQTDASGAASVELTVAVHYVFDTPGDKLIWDVGHQAYPHKIVTGRRDRIRTLRQGGGLSGFTRRSESEYDPFGAAHSSTSISAALGFAIANKLSGEAGRAIAVIGDGALSAGMSSNAS